MKWKGYVGGALRFWLCCWDGWGLGYWVWFLVSWALALGVCWRVSDYALTDASSVLRFLWAVGWMSERLGPVRWVLAWVTALGFDEPESLILAQSERWRHA